MQLSKKVTEETQPHMEPRLKALLYNFTERLEWAVTFEAKNDLVSAANEYKSMVWFGKANMLEDELLSYTGISLESLAKKTILLYERAAWQCYNSARYPADYYKAAVMFENAAYLCKNLGVYSDRLEEYAEQAVRIYITNEHADQGLKAARHFSLKEATIKKAESKAGQWAHERYEHFMKVGDRLMKANEPFNAVAEYAESLNTAKGYLGLAQETRAAESIARALKDGINRLLHWEGWPSRELGHIAVAAAIRADVALEHHLDRRIIGASANLAHEMLILKAQRYLDKGNTPGAVGALRYLKKFCIRHGLEYDFNGFAAQIAQSRAKAAPEILIRLESEEQRKQAAISGLRQEQEESQDHLPQQRLPVS